MQFAKRPKFLREENGQIGQNPVRCNSFELEAGDVTVQGVRLTPDVPQQQGALQRAVLGNASRDQLSAQIGTYMVFGTQVVGSRRVQGATVRGLQVEGQTYDLTLAPAKPSDEAKLKESFLNNIFNRAQLECKYTQIGRKFFDVGSRTQVDPEQGISVVTGFSSAIHLREDEHGAQRAFVEVDTTQKVYFDQTVLQTMNQLRDRHGERDLRARILERFKGRYVITEYDTSKAQRITDVNFEMGPSHRFTLGGGRKEQREVSYKDQLRERWAREVRTDNQPMLVSEQKRGRGGKTDTIQLVPEFCRETGLNDELRAGGFMMKLLKAKPRQDERIRKYSQFLTRVFADAKDLFERYNIRLKGGRPSMLALDGGRMPPGKISFGGTQHDLAQKSMFDREAQGGVFSAPNAFKWAILSLQGDQENVRAKETFVREFQSACQRSRLAVSEPVVQELPRNAQQWLQAMRDLRQADFLLLVVPARGRKKDDLNLYKLTKRLAIAELAVPTQVVLSKTLTGKGVTSIVSKVLTQVVAKLNNGAPWGLVQPECTDAPTMVCGVDVWHGQGKSIMGFTASLDQNFSKQTSDVRTQDMKEELSAEIAGCVKGCAEGFKALNGMWPARIIVQRDGVSEGQFQTALNQEVGAIQDILAKHAIDARLVFVVVNKRVDTKIMHAQKDEGCLEGTVVDQTITRPGMYDFYIVPLSSRQGMANPVYQTVLHDGSQGSPVEVRPHALFTLSQKLCFMYQNWTGPVRAPAPVMFAHKLAQLLGDLSERDQAVVPKPKLATSVSCWYL